MKHFFLGDTKETLEALAKKATEEFGAKVVGSYSPPFKPLEEYDIVSLAKMINESGATIVWTALTAPKQDFLDSMLLPYINQGVVLVGVGAAFRSVIGGIRQPDGILQKMGLAGIIFHRKGRSRWKQAGWYFKHTLYLIKYFFCIKWRRMAGNNYWE